LPLPDRRGEPAACFDHRIAPLVRDQSRQTCAPCRRRSSTRKTVESRKTEGPRLPRSTTAPRRTRRPTPRAAGVLSGRATRATTLESLATVPRERPTSHTEHKRVSRGVLDRQVESYTGLKLGSLTCPADGTLSADARQLV
jgi:hypothetical protein